MHTAGPTGTAWCAGQAQAPAIILNTAAEPPAQAIRSWLPGQAFPDAMPTRAAEGSPSTGMPATEAARARCKAQARPAQTPATIAAKARARAPHTGQARSAVQARATATRPIIATAQAAAQATRNAGLTSM